MGPLTLDVAALGPTPLLEPRDHLRDLIDKFLVQMWGQK